MDEYKDRCACPAKATWNKQGTESSKARKQQIDKESEEALKKAMSRKRTSRQRYLENMMTKVYLASPLGFSLKWKTYRDKIKQRLNDMDCTVFDPWDQKFHATTEEARAIQKWSARATAFKVIATRIGKANEEAIRDSDILLGVLDGLELDSGTVSEIGFAAGLGKKCYGLRTDFRNSGDFDGIPINLQVLYWIESSGGMLFRRISAILF